MDLVIDANILFAALIKDNITSELLFEEELDLFAPEFMLTEFEKYRETIKSKSNRSDEEFNVLLDIFLRTMEFVPVSEINPYIKKVETFCPDAKDIPYLALALKLQVPVWSNDKKLKQGQTMVKVLDTHDLLQLIY